MTILLIGALALLFISAALAPLESLSWWAGWYGTRDELEETTTLAPPATNRPAAASTHYMVYLSGIGAMSGDSVPPEEIVFLDALDRQLPRTTIVGDVFPYSVTNAGLTGQRLFAKTWRGIERLRLKRPEALLTKLVNVRNVFQVAVSADQRYGPIYNFGVAVEIARSLQRAGYPAGSGTPVTLLGWSGGGQISLGAATYLARMLNAPLRIISIGGVMSSDPGVRSIEHLYHLYGEKDTVQRLGAILFSGRWPVTVTSPWNQALAQGKITFVCLGPVQHNGTQHYLDTENRLPNGQTFAEQTVQSIVDICIEAGLDVAGPANTKRVPADLEK